MRKLVYFIRLHMVVGCVGGLVIPLVIVGSIFVMDIVRAGARYIDVSEALLTLPRAEWLGDVAWLGLALGLAAPACAAPWVAFSRGASGVTRFLREGSLGWRWAYYVLVVVCSYCVVVAHGLVVLGGPASRGLEVEDAFQPFLLHTARVPGMAITVIAVVFGLLASLKQLTDFPKTLRLGEYTRRLELSALPSMFAPLYSRSMRNCNASGIAPMLRGIEANWRVMMREYNVLVPGSDAAKEYLTAAWRNCKSQLGGYGVIESAGKQIRLAPSTCRAIDVILDEQCSGRRILLSPFEHPTERTVASLGRQVEQLEVGPDYYQQPWVEQKRVLIDWVIENASRPRAARAGFILSEVCWMTGSVLPVASFMDELAAEWVRRDADQSRRPVLIVDGAHAVGNTLGGHPIECCDGYFFGGHKWLLSPEPCGIAVARGARRTYDLWVDQVPETTVGPGAVLALGAALRAVSGIGQAERWERSQRLKERLLERLDGRLVDVAEGNGLEGSCMLALKPGMAFEWGDGVDAVQRRMAEARLTAQIITAPVVVGADQMWVRVCLPFFLDWRFVDDVVRVLRSLVRARQ